VTPSSTHSNNEVENFINDRKTGWCDALESAARRPPQQSFRPVRSVIGP
jgi:hypothetical protein